MKLHELQAQARRLGLEVTARPAAQIPSKKRDKSVEGTHRSPQANEVHNNDSITNTENTMNNETNTNTNAVAPVAASPVSVIDRTNAALDRLADGVERQMAFNPRRAALQSAQRAAEVTVGVLLAVVVVEGTKAAARGYGRWRASKSALPTG